MLDKASVGNGSRKRVLDFLLANVGKVVSTKEMRAAANVSEYARRLRELRDQFGYQIRSHKDLAHLKPGEYVLESPEPSPSYIFSGSGISKETRAFVLERNGYTCQMCGLGASDADPFHPGRKVRLTMGHIIDKSKGGADTADNLRAVCTNCNEGLQNTSPPKPQLVELMKQLRRATIDDQLHALEWLETKFANIRPGKRE
jgi:HNH endonuclease